MESIGWSVPLELSQATFTTKQLPNLGSWRVSKVTISRWSVHLWWEREKASRHCPFQETWQWGKSGLNIRLLSLLAKAHLIWKSKQRGQQEAPQSKSRVLSAGPETLQVLGLRDRADIESVG